MWVCVCVYMREKDAPYKCITFRKREREREREFQSTIGHRQKATAIGHYPTVLFTTNISRICRHLGQNEARELSKAAAVSISKLGRHLSALISDLVITYQAVCISRGFFFSSCLLPMAGEITYSPRYSDSQYEYR
jgi:hypothetical protein